MHHHLLLILVLLFVIFLLIMLGQRLKISYPIFLVLAGLGISFVPGIPRVEIAPDLIFLIFLPPLLYEAAWYTSWNDFWKWRRPIAMLAFGLVFFTSVIVAFASTALIPGFTLALGFLLGGIISPPDAVAATSVLKHVSVPQRLTAVLEGESLINDASSLIVFRFALAAVLTGQFAMGQAVGQFFLVAGMGIVVGLAMAHILYAVHRFLPTTPSIDASLTLMAPYFMYIGAEQFHFSGVMAVVSGGLFLSWRSNDILPYSSRLQAWGMWTTVIFVLNGLVFILIGLELPSIIDNLGDYSLSQAIGYGMVISVLTIAIRLLWVFPIAYVPIWFGNRKRMDRVNPTWKLPLIAGWAGMRGVVSLASALSIPLVLDNGSVFPLRNLILFITFIVILMTLVFQGLTLPLLIRWVKIKDTEDFAPAEEQETAITLRLMQAALKRLNENYAEAARENELVGFLQHQLENDIALADQRLASLECDETEREEIALYNHVVLDLCAVQRKELYRLRAERLFSDEEIRKQEMQLDFDEAKITGTHH
ncbi:Na+/H+ antiporter [Chitinophaga pendula]|uniref:Na+/H+ antiporter n=1 Tax=Chitinophaga TaxID=79328 RepID=UPI000BB0C550|nr:MULTISPECIES: Na+/H+ antiporter [Chitinophaga]ASZ11046.1 Na+/H+ antiporter [Chitinophaga sp. MD30]UCJ05954.1 Na+/H+ antiporter [Chitinophaga pendula]